MPVPDLIRYPGRGKWIPDRVRDDVVGGVRNDVVGGVRDDVVGVEL